MVFLAKCSLLSLVPRKTSGKEARGGGGGTCRRHGSRRVLRSARYLRLQLSSGEKRETPAWQRAGLVFNPKRRKIRSRLDFQRRLAPYHFAGRSPLRREGEEGWGEGGGGGGRGQRARCYFKTARQPRSCSGLRGGAGFPPKDNGNVIRGEEGGGEGRRALTKVAR